MMHFSSKAGLNLVLQTTDAPTATFYPAIQTQLVGNNLPGLLDHATGHSEPARLTGES